MPSNSKIQVDYTTKTRNFQLVFPINFEINIPADDSVRLLSNVLEEIDYTELYGAYSRKEKNTAVSPKNLFKVLVYAYMNNIYSSRQIETACKRDINFMYLLEGAKAPDHNTIARFRSSRLKDIIDNLMLIYNIHTPTIIIPNIVDKEHITHLSIQETIEKQKFTLCGVGRLIECKHWERAIRAIEIQQYYIDHPDEAKNAQPSPMQDVVIVGVDIDRECRRNRISKRLISRLDEGMVDEVRAILNSGVPAEDLIYYGLEYKYLTMYVTGEISYEQMVSELEIAIHQFAKRQMTWFRGMERRGFKINWLPWDMPKDKFVDAVIKLL